MAKKRLKLCALLLPVLTLLTGCWDSTEVNHLNLSTMVILDKQEGEFSFTVEIAKVEPAGADGGGGTKQEYLEGSGANFAEARNDLDMKMDKPLYLSTVRALVVTERAAENDLAEYLFRLREDQSYRQKVYTTITGEDPQALIDFKNETNQPAGFVIDDTIHTASALNHTYVITTGNLVNDILANRGFVVQHIGLVGNQIKLNGYSVFRDAKLVGFIPLESSRGLTYLLAEEPGWVYRLAGGGTNYTVEVRLKDRKIKPSYQDGRILFQVQLAFEAMIQYQSEVSLFPLDERIKGELAGSLSAILTQEVRDTVEQSQIQFQSDYLMLGEAFRVAYPEAYERMDWGAEYPRAEVQASASVDISVSDKLDLQGAS